MYNSIGEFLIDLIFDILDLIVGMTGLFLAFFGPIYIYDWILKLIFGPNGGI